MKNQLNFVCVAGFGYSGSGALLDILKEFNDYFVFEKEFRILKDPDGLIDLENALIDNWQELGSDIAIRRFKRLIRITSRRQKLLSQIGYNYNNLIDHHFEAISNNYIEDLIDIEWPGNWPYHLHELSWINYFVYRIKNRLGLNPALNDRMYFSYPEERFYGSTRTFIDNIFCGVAESNLCHTVVLDQCLPPYKPMKYLRYFNSAKAIVVDRDPRDIYAELSHFSSYPTRPVEYFVKYFKSQRLAVDKANEKDYVLRIRFEDMVYDYDKTMSIIYNFLGIEAKNHLKMMTHFNPKLSSANVGLWKRFGVHNDIIVIENELNEYLYSL